MFFVHISKNENLQSSIITAWILGIDQKYFIEPIFFLNSYNWNLIKTVASISYTNLLRGHNCIAINI